MIDAEQLEEINIRGLKDSKIITRHYQRKRDSSWQTAIELELESKAFTKEGALAVCDAILRAVAVYDRINQGEGKRGEDDLYEDIDYDKPRQIIWIETSTLEAWGWTVDIYLLVTGHYAYQLTQHRGPNWTYSRLIHGAYENQYNAIQAAITEFRALLRR
jgi:hypothetical protein